MFMGPKRKPRALLMKEWFTLRGKNIIKLMENSKEESDRTVALIPRGTSAWPTLSLSHKARKGEILQRGSTPLRN